MSANNSEYVWVKSEMISLIWLAEFELIFDETEIEFFCCETTLNVYQSFFIVVS